MALDDDDLAEIFGEEEHVSPLTERVAELLRCDGVRERFCKQCKESQERTQERRDKYESWNRKRSEYFSKVPWEEVFVEKNVYFYPKDFDYSFDAEVKDDEVRCEKVRQSAGQAPTTPSQEAPTQGWVLATGRGFSPDGAQSAEVRTWVPPELGDDKEPDDFQGPLLPFPSHHVYTMTLADWYFVLAVVHDAERKRIGKIDPFPPEDLRAFWSYKLQKEKVSGLSKSDRLALRDCLVRVEADLREMELLVGAEPVANVNAIRNLTEKMATVETLIKPNGEREPKQILEAMAMALLLTIGPNAKKIAEKVGVPRTTLLSWETFRAAYDKKKGEAQAEREKRRQRLRSSDQDTDETDDDE